MSTDVKWFLSFRFFTTIAMQMKMTILGYFLYDINGAAIVLGLLGLYEAVPKILLALPAGYQAERMEKRKALAIVVGGYFIFSVIICISLIHFRGQNSTLTQIVYAAVFLMGVIGSLGVGASFAMFSNIIPKEKIVEYSAWNSYSWQIGAVVGPLIGCFFFDNFGVEISFSIVAFLLLIALISILQLPKYESQISDKFSINDTIIKIKEGLNYVLSNRVMLWAITLDLFAVLFGGCVALLPIFAKDILMVGVSGYGVLKIAMPLGAAITMLFLVRNPIRQNTGKWLIVFVGLFGLATLGFAVSTSFYISLALLFLMGAFDAVSVVIRGAILMLETPDHMRARVTSVNSMFISSSNEIGAFESGFAAQILGTVRSVLFGGSMTLLFVTIAWNKAKSLKNYSMK
jgi:MFS family permease